ncbi:MAG: alanine racemase [Acidobacteria bacterium]|nr:alanine racemase [Acidobacteriota bacterium]
MNLSEIETPAILIDLDRMERNLRRAAEYAREHDLRLRPHTKTHKIPALGRRQIESGAAGLTVAKVGEAEVMLASETPDLLVAYPIIGRSKLERLMQVARRARVTVALDSAVAARQLSDAAREAQTAIAVLAEVDVGLGRVGVRPGEELEALIRAIERLPWLSFEGLDFYPGHIRGAGEDSRQEIEKLSETVGSMLAGLKRAGLEPKIVSGGSTPTLFHSHLVAGVNEIRPGTYIFNDRNTAAAGACSFGDCAATILVTVVSTARPGQIIIDGGSKTFSSDRHGAAGEATFGHFAGAPEAVFHKMNEEHGYVDVRRAGRDFSVGDRLRVIPNHICVAMNLHERVYGIRGETVETVWTVEGRGKLQ